MREDGIQYEPDGSPRYFSPAPDMRPDPYMVSQRFWEELEKNRQARELAEADAQRQAAEEALKAEEAYALRLMNTNQAVEGYQRFITAVCERLKIRTVIKVNAKYLAWCRTRTIQFRPIVDDETFCSALHEIGHILNGECSRREPHRLTVEDGFHKCIECEAAAWERAMQLAPFSREMHDTLRTCLMSYKRRISAGPDAIAALDAVSSRLGFLRHKQNYLVHEMRLERQRIVDEQLARERVRYLGATR